MEGFLKDDPEALTAAFNRRQDVITHGDEENQGSSSKEFPKGSKLHRFLQRIHGKTLMHKQALQLLKMLTSEAVKHGDNKAYKLLGPSIGAATRSGVPEFVREAIKTRPYSIWFADHTEKEYFPSGNFAPPRKSFQSLITGEFTQACYHTENGQRREQCATFGGQFGTIKEDFWCCLADATGIAMVQEVEKIVQPSYKKMKNNKGKTPRELFTEEHKGLVEQGEKWMKDTGTSCALVAALVITVVFAANFTAPGGNDQTTGFPIFLNKASFMTFAIANALALSSSSTSLLMFLGILTSRYSEADFLRALPMRLSIGLITLFFSIAAMLTAFSASLHIVLSHKVSLIGVPIGLVACVPITLFAILQFPLLLQILHSTFGPGSFHEQGEEILI